MAQFLAGIQGQRGEATRLGSKASGIRARINGWNAGVSVNAYHEDGVDVFEIRQTGGSGYSGINEPIATIRDGVLILNAKAVKA